MGPSIANESKECTWVAEAPDLWLSTGRMIRKTEPATLDTSLITVNFRTIGRLERLLETIERHRPQVSHEYIVVENGSPDPTEHLLTTRFPWARYHRTENRGFAAGNNRGMELGHGRYFLLLNPDVEIFPGMIDAWIRWMDAHPDVGISGPRLVYPDQGHQPAAFHFHRLLTPLLRRTRLGETAWGKRQLGQYERVIPEGIGEDGIDAEWLLGAALCLRRETALALGGLDERFFLYFEDEDLCRRAWRAGYRVTHLPHITLQHAYGKLSHVTSWKDVFRKRAVREHVKSFIRYFARYGFKTTP